jgi:SAM-dependent methyltransferase
MTYLPYKRQPMILPYDITKNSKGREYLNRKLMPYFASFFKNGDRILFVGRHPKWDYSIFFNGPHKQCEYIVSDIDKETNPDVIDDITQSKFETNSFDGVIIIGIFDSFKPGSKPDNFKSELVRIIRPGGRVLMALNHFPPNGAINAVDAWPEFMVDEVYRIFGKSNLVEKEGWYGNGLCQAIFLIMRKK